MSDALQRLIEAIEAGQYDRDMAGCLPYPHNKGGTAYAAFYGDLNAAKDLHDALLPGWEWGRLVSHGTMVVARKTGQYQQASAEDNGNPARALLLAILRAYQQVQQ